MIRQQIDRILRGRVITRVLDKFVVRRAFNKIRSAAFLKLIKPKVLKKNNSSKQNLLRGSLQITDSPDHSMNLEQASSPSRQMQTMMTEKMRFPDLEIIQKSLNQSIPNFTVSKQGSEKSDDKDIGTKFQEWHEKVSLSDKDDEIRISRAGNPFLTEDWDEFEQTLGEKLLDRIERNNSEKNSRGKKIDPVMYQTLQLQPINRYKKSSLKQSESPGSNRELSGSPQPRSFPHEVSSKPLFDNLEVELDTHFQMREPPQSPVRKSGYERYSRKKLPAMHESQPLPQSDKFETQFSRNPSTKTQSSECLVDSIEIIQKKINTLSQDKSGANDEIINALARKLQDIKAILQTKRTVTLEQAVSLRTIVSQIEEGIVQASQSQILDPPRPSVNLIDLQLAQSSTEFMKKDPRGSGRNLTAGFGVESRMSVDMPLKASDSRKSLKSINKQFESAKPSSLRPFGLATEAHDRNKSPDAAKKRNIECLNFLVLFNLMLRKHAKRQVKEMFGILKYEMKNWQQLATLRNLAEKISARQSRKAIKNFARQIFRNGVILRRFLSQTVIDYGRMMRQILRRMSRREKESSFYVSRYLPFLAKQNEESDIFFTFNGGKKKLKNDRSGGQVNITGDLFDLLKLVKRGSSSDQSPTEFNISDLSALYQKLEAEYESQF